MAPENIVGFTAAISIAFRFLEPIHHNLQMAQNLQEQRLLAFDKIVSAAKLLLQQVGRAKYMDSMWALWSQLSQSIFMLERTLWPNQPPETELHITLPPSPRPLFDVLLDNFDESATYIFQAIAPLESFHQWFTEEYDTVLHTEFNTMLLDSLLLFRTCESMLRMKQRLQSLPPAPATPVALDPPVAHTAAAPSAASTQPAATDTMVMRNADGELVAWY